MFNCSVPHLYSSLSTDLAVSHITSLFLQHRITLGSSVALSCHVSLLNLQLLLAFLCLSWHWLFKLFLYLAASGLRCVQWGLPLPHAYSLVVVRGLSCSGPCGILVPHPWIKRSCPASQGRFLREVLTLPLFEGYTCYLVECPSVWICLGSPHEKIQVSTILYP